MEFIPRRPQREANPTSFWCNSTVGRMLPKMGKAGTTSVFGLKDFYRRITTALYPPLKPMQSPSQTEQLHYQVFVEGSPIRALLDPGASHSFIWEEWARTQKLTYTPLDPPRAVGVFNGEKEYVRYVAHVKKFGIAGHVRPWNFYVIARSPTPIVVGLDAVRAMPLFYNPLNDCLYVAPELGRSYGELGGRYQAAERELGGARARALAQEALECHGACEEDTSSGTHRKEPILGEAHEGHTVWAQNGGVGPGTDTSDEEGYLQLHTVTGSGEEEEKILEEFLSTLTPEMRRVVDEFPALFGPPDADPPPRSVKHHIYVSPDSVPAARRAYPLGDVKKAAMREQMTDLVEKGWVGPSSSPWAAPILFVPKDGGTKWRMCVDFRDLNALTKKDAFPLPRLDLLLHRANRATVFSKIDLASGFHQIEVHPRHRELTAFILPEPILGSALWEWKVMPFGLVNAPPTFQRAMTVALRGCEDFAAVYIDDVLVFSDSPEQHLDHLRKVFSCLQKEAYHVRLAKCEFMASSVRFSGPRVDGGWYCSRRGPRKEAGSVPAPVQDA